MQNVLQITRKADYALRAAVYLASIRDSRVVTFKELARLIRVPADFLAKILKELADAGIVRSVRGPKGGYSLLKARSEVSFLEIIEAVEGPVAINICIQSRDNCTFGQDCTLTNVWHRGQERMLEVFRETKLSQLVSPFPISQKVVDAEKGGGPASLRIA
jgi:Rrf2 family protein